MDEIEAETVVAAGRGWNRLNGAKGYEKYDTGILLAGLAKLVRPWCGIAVLRTLAGRKAGVADEVIDMLKSGSLDAKRGACVALKKMGRRGSGAAGQLEATSII